MNLLWFIDETQCFALNAMDEWNYAVFELEDSIFRSELNQPEVRIKSVENFKLSTYSLVFSLFNFSKIG